MLFGILEIWLLMYSESGDVNSPRKTRLNFEMLICEAQCLDG
jgi:hypothetical protein